jgi:large subunit ribosomal protein L29
MKPADLREKSESELSELNVTLRRQLFGLRMKHHTSQLGDTSQLQKLRRDIARVQCALTAAAAARSQA